MVVGRGRCIFGCILRLDSSGQTSESKEESWTTRSIDNIEQEKDHSATIGNETTLRQEAFVILI
jgi:hypothetical protein